MSPEPEKVCVWKMFQMLRNHLDHAMLDTVPLHLVPIADQYHTVSYTVYKSTALMSSRHPASASFSCMLKIAVW